MAFNRTRTILTSDIHRKQNISIKHLLAATFRPYQLAVTGKPTAMLHITLTVNIQHLAYTARFWTCMIDLLFLNEGNLYHMHPTPPISAQSPSDKILLRARSRLQIYAIQTFIYLIAPLQLSGCFCFVLIPSLLILLLLHS